MNLKKGKKYYTNLKHVYRKFYSPLHQMHAFQYHKENKFTSVFINLTFYLKHK